MEACQLNASLKGETVELWLFCESKPIFKASLWSSWMLKKIFYKGMSEELQWRWPRNTGVVWGNDAEEIIHLPACKMVLWVFLRFGAGVGMRHGLRWTGKPVSPRSSPWLRVMAGEALPPIRPLRALFCCALEQAVFSCAALLGTPPFFCTLWSLTQPQYLISKGLQAMGIFTGK